VGAGEMRIRTSASDPGDAPNACGTSEAPRGSLPFQGEHSFAGESGEGAIQGEEDRGRSVVEMWGRAVRTSSEDGSAGADRAARGVGVGQQQDLALTCAEPFRVLVTNQ
jgi:hypothetical protein